MSKLSILVAEDKEEWQVNLKEILVDLCHKVAVEIAPDYATALRQIKNQKFDLATVDLSLSGAPPISSDTDLLGMELMREWRASNQNQACGLIVLTGYPTLDRTKEALLKYGAFDFIEKQNFDNREFVDTARAAILDARLKYASKRREKVFYFTVNFNEESFVGCKMSGPGRATEYMVPHPPRLKVSDLIRRADDLNITILNGSKGRWRQEANSIGDGIYQTLADEQRIIQDLTSSRTLPDQSKDLWLEFNGPAAGLGIPFELLRDGRDSLCLRHILTRRLVQEGFISYNTYPFHTFIQRLQENSEILRLLIVGSNSDGNIPLAEEEARELKTVIEKELQALGILYEITALIGEDATYDHVKDALRSGSYHIFHYAGHGRFMDTLPEISGLVLLDNGEPITLSASDLNLLVKDSHLQFVFLSCCLSARSEQQVGRGDFSSILEALARAGIPSVLGYRWVVADTSALLLAKSFYETLWRTFSPAESLMEARNSVATSGPAGRDDETWLSPVLLVQNR